MKTLWDIGACNRAMLRRGERFLLIGSILLAAFGGGATEQRGAEYAAPPIHDGVDRPVVELPLVDFGMLVTSAQDDLSPLALGQSIPHEEFLVRFQGRRAAGKVHFPAIFAVQQRWPDGRFVQVAEATMTPRGNTDGELATYEGICRKPSGRGPCLIEVRLLGKSHLVRSSDVR